MTWGVHGLSVSFGGRVALSDVDLDVEPGRVTAVVGGDGAGKTTLLRVMAGLPVAYQGVVRIPGIDQVGYVPSAGGGFTDLTVAENMEFFAAAHGTRHPEAAASLLERTGLAEFTRRLAGDLSGGMRRKLAVVSVMQASPDLLILDEPTTGVDPVSRSELWRLIAAAATSGTAVLVTSAYLDEAERASTVLVLQEGRTLVSGTPDEVKASMPGAVVELAEPTDRSNAWRSGPAWREWRPGGRRTSDPTLEDVVIVAGLAGRS